MHSVFDLGAAMIDVPCPECEYILDIALVDVRAQASVWCPCCRSRILLRDADGSVSVSIDEAQDAVRQLEKTLKGMFG
jgi:uncharacterized Zn finger protein (UPF0148 family)